jgi:hypothetical protein
VMHKSNTLMFSFTKTLRKLTNVSIFAINPEVYN